MSSLATSIATTRGCAFAISNAPEQSGGGLHVRHQLFGGGQRRERLHLLRRNDLRHQNDVGPALEHRCQVFAPAGFQGIDADAGNLARLSPLVVQRRGQRPGPRAQFRRGEILEFLDQHVGPGARRRRVRSPHRRRARTASCGADGSCGLRSGDDGDRIAQRDRAVLRASGRGPCGRRRRRPRTALRTRSASPGAGNELRIRRSRSMEKA